MAHDTTMCSLISGLPDEVALRCLARVPFYYHRNLHLVCRSWRAALCSPEVFKVRCEAGVFEELLCILYDHGNVWQLYDPCRDHWLTLNVMPSQRRFPYYFDMASIAVAGKLFMLGGGHSQFIGDHDDFKFATSEVWSYDPFYYEWSRRANMLFPRTKFACCSLNGKIVVAGGFTSFDETISKAEIYDPDTDTWRSLPDLRHAHTSTCSGVVIGGKFHVFHKGLSVVQILEDGQQWSVEDFGWPQGPMAVVGEELYILNVEGFILKYQQENNLFYRLVAVPVPFYARTVFDKWDLLFEMIGLGDGLYVIVPLLGVVYVLSVNSNSPTWRLVSPMTELSDIILNCALLKV